MDWFSSYLSDRTQTFCANGVMSEPIPVTCSVPQGFVLGPVLFISYTEDVTSIFDSHQVNHLLYADDKQAYVSVPVYDVSLARQTLEHCISDIIEASPTVAQPPGTLFLLISTILETLIRSENDSRVYFLIVLTTDYCWRSWACRITAPYKFYVD